MVGIIAGIIIVLISCRITIFKGIHKYQNRKLIFLYEGFRENSLLHLRIHRNSKIIQTVTTDSITLHFSDKDNLYEGVMRINECQNLEIGKDTKTNYQIIIKYGKHKIKKKISEIPISKDVLNLCPDLDM